MRARYGVILAIGVWWLWPRGAERPPTLQTAVLPDGFAVIERGTQHRVVELDDAGTPRRTFAIRGLPADTRIVGAPTGIHLVWKAGKRVAVAPLDRLDRPSLFGKDVQRMCEQTATNQARFGVAWTERDGGIWFVHGTTSAMTEPAEPAAQPVYCAVASAGDQLALLWRTGDRFFLARCGKRCGIALRPDLDRDRTILGFGCTRTDCVIVSRDPEGTVAATWIDKGARVVWTKPLRDACRDTRVEIVGIGQRLAIAYSLGPEPVVVLADRDATFKPVWQGGGDPDSVPSLAWSGTALLVAFQRDGQLQTARLVP